MLARQVIMIRPLSFGFNPETALSNYFQQPGSLNPAAVQSAALKEFDALANLLTTNHVDVKIFQDTALPVKPDAVFPNNWFSTHADGTVILYPMLNANRRPERREDIVQWLQTHFQVSRVIDLSPNESQQLYLEGTGSLVFDHHSRKVYTGLSPRTNEALVHTVAGHLGYEAIVFRATDSAGRELYHTNVVMSISDTLCVLCAEAISENRHAMESSIRNSGKELLIISMNQMENFAGNMLLPQNTKAEPVMIMSTRAFQSLNAVQIKTIEKHASILHSDLSVIETVGGGSARCMLAENFLPLSA